VAPRAARAAGLQGGVLVARRKLDDLKAAETALTRGAGDVGRAVVARRYDDHLEAAAPIGLVAQRPQTGRDGGGSVPRRDDDRTSIAR